MGNFLQNVTATDDTALYNRVGRVDDRVPSISRSFACYENVNLARTLRGCKSKESWKKRDECFN